MFGDLAKRPSFFNLRECSSITNKEETQSKKKRKLTSVVEHVQHFHTSKKTKTTPHPHPLPTTTSLRPWVFNSRHNCSHLQDNIVIVSYNILGVENAKKHPHLYNNFSQQYLNWERRKLRIRNELNSYNASILCLQASFSHTVYLSLVLNEVDRFDDLAKILKIDGFTGIYKARTGEACDGCAIFWREELFTLVHQESIEFRNFDLRDNVAQFCVLKMESNYSNKVAKGLTSRSRNLLIGNIHALFNPKRGDIKIGQSAIYKFLASSELNLQRHDRRQLSVRIEAQSRWNTFRAHTKMANRWNEEELQLAAGRIGVTHLKHHLQLYSAYVGVPGSSSTRDRYGEPLATSYHSLFLGTSDYIWHSKELVPVGVVDTLSITNLRKTRGLPSEEWGSDHLALVCKLAFADDNNGT
ncbi:hypothetical protein IFM89_020485 [Coptis chinensis]|uniref:Endonuclease/exonuclease/phosphatase domain-containing protein n=1 Tax=Coptis chinensis TaxID=261450 RepID=A0A835H5B6_9MAGN|nr:hypothetical protein IFM89_020485 [Coptis chinensis]